MDKSEAIDKMEREIVDLKILLCKYERKMQFFMHNDESKTVF